MTKSKKLKKWQVVLIVILLVAVALFAGLKVFKKQVLSAVLNDKELAAYDCCKKSNRVYDSLGIKNHITKIEYCEDSEDILSVMVYGKSKDIQTRCVGTYILNLSTMGDIVFWMRDNQSNSDEEIKVKIDYLINKDDLYPPDELLYDSFINKDNTIYIHPDNAEEKDYGHILKKYADDYNVTTYTVPFYKIWIINL